MPYFPVSESRVISGTFWDSFLVFFDSFYYLERVLCIFLQKIKVFVFFLYVCDFCIFVFIKILSFSGKHKHAKCLQCYKKSKLTLNKLLHFRELKNLLVQVIFSVKNERG